MQKSNALTTFASRALAILICAMGIARAQYNYTAGTAPGGGNTIVASGTPGALTTEPPLSAGGGDFITITPGTLVLSTISTDSISITTSNDTVLNNGTILGETGGFNAITFNPATASNETVTNNGSVTGGAGGTGSSGGNGIQINPSGSVTSLTLTNTGNLSGGIGGGGTANGGAGGVAIEIDPSGDVTFFTLTNTGNLSGGTGGAASSGSATAGSGGLGIEIDPSLSVSNLMWTINGNISGGAGGFAEGGIANGGSGGLGIEIDPSGAVSNLTWTINGNISGGAGGATDGAAANSGAGGLGIEIDPSGAVSNLTWTINGNISGGAGGFGDGATGNGGAGGPGIEIDPSGVVSNLTLSVNGNISGGSGGSAEGSTANGGAGAAAIEIDPSGLNNLKLTINGSGSVFGGNGGSASGATANAGNAGDAIDIFPSTTGGANFVTVFGRVSGGSASPGGNAGIGISASVGNLTINNWGAISTGGGNNAAAINLQTSSNNVVNLNGHSSVNGLITANGATNSNILNLNFTGLTPAAITMLRNQLLAQSIPLNNGIQSTGTFTVRGVTYHYDPFVLNLNATSYQLQAITPNQVVIGEVFDSLTYNPAPGSPLLNLLNAIDMSGNVPGALDEVSPQKYEIYGDLAIANASFTAASVDARLNNLRDGSESIDTSGIGGDTVAEVVTGNSKDDSSKESKEIQPAAPAPKQWGFFATGNGLFFRGNSHDADLQEGKADSAGTIAGIDGKVGDHGVIGALFAYNNADATLGADNSHATIESYTGGLYASYHNDGFYANGLAAYTRNNYKSERNITLPGFSDTADGSTNGNQYSANLDGGYDWNVTNRLTVGPVAGVQYVHMDVDGFNESGFSAADLALGSQNMNSLQSRVGLRANFHLATTQSSSFALDLHAAWQHEYLDDSRGISASFEGSGLVPFSVQTASPKRDAGVVGTGLNWTFHDRLTLFAEYELELWSTSYFEQTVNGGARISF